MGADALGVAARAAVEKGKSGLSLSPVLREISRSALKLQVIAPALVVGVLLAFVPGVSEELRATREAVIADALTRAELTVAVVAHEVARAAGPGPARAFHLDLAVAKVPAGAQDSGRLILFDDADSWTASSPRGGPPLRHLSDLFEEAMPVALFGERAGAMRVQLADGTDALAAVRKLPAGRLVIVKPVAEIEGARLWGGAQAGLALAALLAIGGLGAGCVSHARRATRAGQTCARMQRRIDTSLARGRCGLWDWDVSRGRVYWSRSFYELLGYERRDEYLSFGEVNSLINPEDGDLYVLAERIASSKVRHIDHDFRMRTADGGWLWLRARAEATTDPEDGTQHLLGIAVDIMDERGFVERSATADMRLRDAVEAVSEAFVLWDAQNRLVLCNSKFRAFHGLPPEAALPGASYAEVIAAGRAPPVASHVIRDECREAGARTLEVQLSDGRWLQINERRTKDGGYVSVGTDITALKRHEEKLVESERRLIGTVSDLKRSRLTLQTQAQQLAELAERYHEQKAQAETASRAKTDFLAKMSHELRTPLNAVIGFAEVMQGEMFGPLGNERYRDYASHIRGSGLDLLAVINDILQISRIEAGHVTLTTGPIEVADAVNDALASVADSARQKGIAISWAGAGGLVQADARALHQALTHVLQNSVKFTPGGGIIRVRVSRTARAMNVFLEDSGVGIPREFMPKLGRPFEQVEPEFNRALGGAGLGLAIAKALTHMQGGGLRIRSQEGLGTIVLVSLPLADAGTLEPVGCPGSPAATELDAAA